MNVSLYNNLVILITNILAETENGKTCHKYPESLPSKREIRFHFLLITI